MVGPRGLKGQSGCYITWGVNMHVVCMCSRGFGGMVLYAFLIATCHIKYNRHVWPNARLGPVVTPLLVSCLRRRNWLVILLR